MTDQASLCYFLIAHLFAHSDTIRVGDVDIKRLVLPAAAPDRAPEVVFAIAFPKLTGYLAEFHGAYPTALEALDRAMYIADAIDITLDFSAPAPTPINQYKCKVRKSLGDKFETVYEKSDFIQARFELEAWAHQHFPDRWYWHDKSTIYLHQHMTPAFSIALIDPVSPTK